MNDNKAGQITALQAKPWSFSNTLGPAYNEEKRCEGNCSLQTDGEKHPAAPVFSETLLLTSQNLNR